MSDGTAPESGRTPPTVQLASLPGPCGICGIPGMPQRHRVVDGIAGMLAAGEDPDETAADYGISRDAVDAIAAWAARWPGAQS